MGVVEEADVGGEEGAGVEAGGGDELSVGGIGVEGFGQLVGVPGDRVINGQGLQVQVAQGGLQPGLEGNAEGEAVAGDEAGDLESGDGGHQALVARVDE